MGSGKDRSRERELAAAQEKIRELERLVSSLAAGLGQVEDELRRISQSWAWRWGHGATVLARRLTRRRMVTEGAVDRALERIERIRASNAGLPMTASRTPAEERPAAPTFDATSVRRAEGPRRFELARELRARLGSVTERAAWPPVTIITVSRDGEERLGRLLEGLSRFTDYPDIQLIVIDNGSQQPLEPTVTDSALPDVQTIRNETNRSFSEANNEAVAVATGEILLFINDDVEPFESGWLKELVSTTLGDGVGAAGATLLHVAHHPALSPTGWIVQHRGIRFRLEGELPRAYNLGDGADLFDGGFGAELRCPAVSAACLAVRREAFEQVRGFSTGYRFGTEDVDLGLKLLAVGWDVRCSGRAIAFHRESATQGLAPRLEVGENRRVNRQLFHERWAARLQREIRRGRLDRDGYWTEERAHVGITVSAAEPGNGSDDRAMATELGDATGALGLRVSYLAVSGGRSNPLPGDLDALVTLLDDFDLTSAPATAPVLAWVREAADRWIARPWTERVDRFLGSSDTPCAVLRDVAGLPSDPFPVADPTALLGIVRSLLERLSFVVRIAAPDWDRAERSGDLHFARAIERELKRRGHRCLIQVREEWDQLEGNCFDVSILLRGRSRHRPKPGQLNVLWSISHPDDLTSAECDDYDLVAVASKRHAKELATRTVTPVFVLEQATDPWRFRPEHDPSLARDVVFVGNSRGVRRQALDWLLPTDHDVAVWGSDWDGLIDRRYVAGEHVPNDELRRVYSSAKIVLADHWPDMREYGYISNRIYDALASGATVVSDAVTGIDERLGDAVAIYHSREQLHQTIDSLLADEDQRRRRAEQGRELVRRNHTFEQRLDVLLQQVNERRSTLGYSTSIVAQAEVP